jgi:DNA invertase Pin-like site-specific DNA recombinase
MVQPRGRPSRLARLRILDFSGNAVDTRRATGRLMLNMFAAMAQFEHEMMLERQREGIAKAKANTDADGVPTSAGGKWHATQVIRVRERLSRRA